MVGIIVKNYEHTNRALGNWDTPNGKFVRSKAHYEKLCKEQGMVPYEQAMKIADKAQKSQQKPYILSDKAKHIINTAKMSADKKGRVKLGDKTIKAMQDMGMDFNKAHCPSHYAPKGGWDAAK